VSVRGNGSRRSERRPKTLEARAIAMLARREYSRAEIRAKLVAGSDSADAGQVDRVLDSLVALGYLSDARFASTVVAQKIGSHSKRSIGATLKARGIDDEAAVAALEASEVDDHDAMVALWRRKFGKAPADDRNKARQVRFLQSRGFSLSAIMKLLRHPPEEGAG
jgi:regulatory protein